jgi:hypothetical protein
VPELVYPPSRLTDNIDAHYDSLSRGGSMSLCPQKKRNRKMNNSCDKNDHLPTSKVKVVSPLFKAMR